MYHHSPWDYLLIFVLISSCIYHEVLDISVRIGACCWVQCWVLLMSNKDELRSMGKVYRLRTMHCRFCEWFLLFLFYKRALFSHSRVKARHLQTPAYECCWAFWRNVGASPVSPQFFFNLLLNRKWRVLGMQLFKAHMLKALFFSVSKETIPCFGNL